MWPKVSILWVNYNSEKIINVVLKSLEGACSLDYPNYELIVVDNGSTDKSFIFVKNFIENRCKIRVKIIRLDRNRGFNAANNIAFKARDTDAKYVVLLNNDAVPTQNSIKELVEVIESLKDRRVAAIQGIITTWDGTSVDNMGFIVDELLFSYPLYRGASPYQIKRPHYCTFVSGAYSLYDINAIKEVNKKDKLFDDALFAFFDDKILGMKLWSHGYKVYAYPIISARHFGGATFGQFSISRFYLTLRNTLILIRITQKFRYKPLLALTYPLYRLAELIINSKSSEDIRIGFRAFSQALYRAYLLDLQYILDYRLDLSKIPVMRRSVKSALLSLFSTRSRAIYLS